MRWVNLCVGLCSNGIETDRVRPPHMKRIVAAGLLILMSACAVAKDSLPPQWAWAPGNCPAGLNKGPLGLFSVMVFCDDALGIHVSVVWSGPMSAPTTSDNQWSLNNRYWHDPLWGSDVTGFAWSNDEKFLHVSTSPVYGSGGIFELDLESRTFTQLQPKKGKVSLKKPGLGYKISGEPLGETRE